MQTGIITYRLGQQAYDRLVESGGGAPSVGYPAADVIGRAGRLRSSRPIRAGARMASWSRYRGTGEPFIIEHRA